MSCSDLGVNMTKPYYSKNKYIKRDNSKSPLLTFTYNTEVGTIYPDFSFDAVLEMVNNDPVARGALNHKIDKCMEGDINIVDKKSRKLDREEEQRLNDKYNFRNDIIRKTFRIGSLFNNVFIENVKTTDNETKSLNVLDSRVIEAITDSNGDPLSYKSRIPDQKTGRYATWNKNEITWIKFGDQGTGYAPVDFRALWENLLAKDYMKQYIAWLWKTGQYRLLYNFEGSSDQDITNFLTYARKNDNNFKAPFVTKGKMETKILRDMKETESLITLLEYYDGQTLILMRVSPIDAGIPDASGRSSSDSQQNAFSTTITSMKKTVEDYINYDLFKKINKSTKMLRFAPNDRFAEQQVWTNIQVMKAINISDEAVEEYLADRGIFFNSTLFAPEPVMETGGVANPKEKDGAISRQRQNGKRDSVGTGSQSSTREDQLRKV